MNNFFVWGENLQLICNSIVFMYVCKYIISMLLFFVSFIMFLISWFYFLFLQISIEIFTINSISSNVFFLCITNENHNINFVVFICLLYHIISFSFINYWYFNVINFILSTLFFFVCLFVESCSFLYIYILIFIHIF